VKEKCAAAGGRRRRRRREGTATEIPMEMEEKGFLELGGEAWRMTREGIRCTWGQG
jgi:intein/homing endonuclease